MDDSILDTYGEQLNDKYGERIWRYTVERAMVYGPNMLAQGYENDMFCLVASAAKIYDARACCLEEEAKWKGRAKCRVRDVTTGNIVFPRQTG